MHEFAMRSQGKIQGLELLFEPEETIKITEYAPEVFARLRNKYVKREEFMAAINPFCNLKGIHDFNIGSGKSASMFYTPINNVFMLKTLKLSEKKLLLEVHEDKVFTLLHSYLMHLVQNPSSLLIKILGVYHL